METEKQEPKKPSRKEMLRLYKKALASITISNNVNVTVNAEIRFKNDETDFNLFVIAADGQDNKNFSFYDFSWTSIAELTTQLNQTLNLIRTDDFLKIKAGIIEQTD